MCDVAYLRRATLNTGVMLHRPSRTLAAVQSVVFRLRHDLKILQNVVRLVPVAVMHVLIGRERATKMLCHDKTVLHNVAVVIAHRGVWTVLGNEDRDVLLVPSATARPTGSRVANTTLCRAASRAKATAAFSNLVGIAQKCGTAVFTCAGDGKITGHGNQPSCVTPGLLRAAPGLLIAYPYSTLSQSPKQALRKGLQPCH
jgi:hypothetical protein